MGEPFYQGKLDTFCAIYAVLNALRLTHDLSVGAAREILNETLLALAQNPEQLRAVLSQKTDYINLVDSMLALQCCLRPLEVVCPFAATDMPAANIFWNECRKWLDSSCAGDRRAIIFRFLRYIRPDAPVINRHWTTADYINARNLHLFDCSHEAQAIRNIRKSGFAASPDKVDSEHLIYIQPETVRFLRNPA